MENHHLLTDAAQRAMRYLEDLDARGVAPTPSALARLPELGGALPDQPGDALEVLRLLDEVGSPTTVATAGRRFFGFVIGGSLPITVAANWLAGAWDQNACFSTTSPVGAALEEIALAWLVDLFGLPPGTGGSFVTGATMANLTALAAARHVVLKKVGWDVEADGLQGAPLIQVVVGAEVHASIIKALRLLGFGRARLAQVPADRQGRMRADALPRLELPCIVCIQAGNVNSGAFDPATEICARAGETGAWVHVDGAFGMWAAAAPERAALWNGFAAADSWGTDTHKWLNVPQDSGLAFVRDAEAMRAAMSTSASYLIEGAVREPSHYTPELSRRARGVEVWAALRTLGRQGLAEQIERCCRHAQRFARGLRAAGYEVLNDVVLNQVVVAFGDAERTRRVIAAIQADGTCWCGSTLWQGHTAMRISVSSWATTEEDVDRSLEAMLRTARKLD